METYLVRHDRSVTGQGNQFERQDGASGCRLYHKIGLFARLACQIGYPFLEFGSEDPREAHRRLVAEVRVEGSPDALPDCAILNPHGLAHDPTEVVAHASILGFEVLCCGISSVL